MIKKGFPAQERAGAQVGPNHTRRRLPIYELIDRWESDRHRVSITDLHIRNTPHERHVNTGHLSGFNLLPLGSEDMQRQEMMTMVISSRGNVTDSHSDDPDGSNHCFVGRKLWLAWDTFEGQAAGLQDCSRDLILARARFNLRAFSRLKSASWWTVNPGETLFLPGRLSHRVVTLERYLGIGSFYVTPVSALENLSRWYTHGALWALDGPPSQCNTLVDEIATRIRQKVQRLAQPTSQTARQWGMDYVRQGMHDWQRRWSATARGRLMRQSAFAGLVAAMESVAPA